MEEICLKGCAIRAENNKLIINAIVTGAKSFWFEVDKEYQPMISDDSVDAFFILYVWLAMENNKSLRVEGKVSKQLSKSVVTKVKNMFLTLYPKLNDIEITVLHPESKWDQSTGGNATGFSGGVDSWYTAVNADKIGHPYSYYLFVNTGQHGIINTNEVFKKRAEHAKRIIRTMKKPILIVNTNIDELFEAPFQQRVVIGNLACALILQKGISKYSYSSGYPTSDSVIKEHYDMSIMDPFLLPSLNTERMKFESIGDNLTRMDKLYSISNAENFSKEIYVCVEKNIPIKNCGVCFKCRRTQIVLDILGAYNLLNNSFDLKYFSKIKNLLIIGLFSQKDRNVSDTEVCNQLIDNKGIYVLHLRIIGFIWKCLKKMAPGWLEWRIKEKYPYLY